MLVLKDTFWNKISYVLNLVDILDKFFNKYEKSYHSVQE